MKRHKRKAKSDTPRWGRNQHWYASWTEYRYGSDQKVSLAQIFKGEKREAAVGGVLMHLRDWRFSPFEREGECRAGVRSALCLEGHSWHRSDAEAASLVDALRRGRTAEVATPAGRYELPLSGSAKALDTLAQSQGCPA